MLVPYSSAAVSPYHPYEEDDALASDALCCVLGFSGFKYFVFVFDSIEEIGFPMRRSECCFRMRALMQKIVRSIRRVGSLRISWTSRTFTAIGIALSNGIKL
jgi:hypothetical protein